jgi:hypothetical protein
VAQISESADDSPDTSDPKSLDTGTAHIARVYDYWLGGKDNFAADRAAGEEALEAFPGLISSVRANRAFLARTVRYLARERGIRQFLDIGTGIPASNNTHEVAQSVAPETRVVYVDNDPMVLAHARALLGSGPHGATDYIDADLRDTGKILGQMSDMSDRLNRLLAQPSTYRSRAEVTSFFDGLELVEPGVVPIQQWRPDTPEEASAVAAMWGGVAFKR